MIWFTSDTHFGHKNIAGPKVSNWKSEYRNFSSLGEMDKELLYQINKVVGENDVLFHLGDFSFCKPKFYRDLITCKNVHLIKGNHDKIKYYHDLFKEIVDYKEIKYDDTMICLFHYAMRVWNKSHYGSIHLYGHSHNSIDNDWGKSMDVGVDAIYALKGEYRPISIDEVMKIMEKRKIKNVDHHDRSRNNR